MTSENKFDANEFLHIFNIEIIKRLPTKEAQQAHTKKLYDSVQSIGKRLDYCQYHFNLFLDTTTPGTLLTEIISGEETLSSSIRTNYEANAVAFLHNLHALIDSLPYILNLIYGIEEDCEARNIGWGDKFIKKFKNYPFYEKLEEVKECETFAKLKGYTNTSKHKYTLRIRNRVTGLSFTEIPYRHDKKSLSLHEKDVKEFLIECHDQLIPDYLKLCALIKNTKYPSN